MFVHTFIIHGASVVMGARGIRVVRHGLSPPGLMHQQLNKQPLLDRGVNGWIGERHGSSDLVGQRESVHRSDFGLASLGYLGVWRWGLGKGYPGSGMVCLRTWRKEW